MLLSWSKIQNHLFDLVKTPIYRVANYHDPVPDIPPASFLISEYRHIGDEYRLRDGAQAPEIIAEDSVINNLLDFAKEAGLAFRTLASDGVSSAIKGVAKKKLKPIQCNFTWTVWRQSQRREIKF